MRTTGSNLWFQIPIFYEQTKWHLFGGESAAGEQPAKDILKSQFGHFTISFHLQRWTPNCVSHPPIPRHLGFISGFPNNGLSSVVLPCVNPLRTCMLWCILWCMLCKDVVGRAGSVTDRLSLGRAALTSSVQLCQALSLTQTDAVP